MAGVNHVGIAVHDIEASIAFYRDVVGMVPERPGTVHLEGRWFDTLTRNQGAKIEVAMLRLGGTTLQLVQYHAGGAAAVATGHNRPGNVHFCIEVDDVDACHAEIVASGRHHPTDIVEIMDTGFRSFYVEDPDGIPVELLQPAAADQAP